MWVNVISSVLEMFILKHWRKKRKETEAPWKELMRYCLTIERTSVDNRILRIRIIMSLNNLMKYGCVFINPCEIKKKKNEHLHGWCRWRGGSQQRIQGLYLIWGVSVCWTCGSSKMKDCDMNVLVSYLVFYVLGLWMYNRSG